MVVALGSQELPQGIGQLQGEFAREHRHQPPHTVDLRLHVVVFEVAGQRGVVITDYYGHHAEYNLETIEVLLWGGATLS